MVENLRKKAKAWLEKARSTSEKQVTSTPSDGVRHHPDSLKRYIWLNPGLNRNERRSIRARLRKNKYRDPKERKFAKWQLENTPVNHQARRGLTDIITNNPFYVGRAV